MSGFFPPCEKCGGSGIYQGAYGEVPCLICGGSGSLVVEPEQAPLLSEIPSPTPVFSAPLAAAARDEAIARVEANADDEWKSRAFGVVKRLALEMAEFTTDDVWKVLVVRPHEPKAMGAVLKQAQAAGLIEPTQGWKQSESVVNHRRPLRVWKSLVFGRLLVE